MGIYLKRTELKKFFKSFFLFFILLSGLIGFIFYSLYKSNLKEFDAILFSQMKMVSMGDKNSDFTISKEPIRNGLKPKKLYEDNKSYYIYFKDKNHSIYNKVSYSKKEFNKKQNKIFDDILFKFFQTLLVVLIISILFSLYILRSYRKYIDLTNEFIRDILHDFNTPISIIRLNVNLLKDRGDTKNIERIDGGINTILYLQQNLREYLEDNIKKPTKFNLQEIILDRVNYMRGIYTYITFKVSVDTLTMFCYRDGFVRIIDNIIDNACKYNRQDGSVEIFYKNKKLYIKDNGIGIKEPKKVFNRFYKENQRGLGIGLHIVKKLTKEMKIGIELKSKVEEGTLFILDLSNVIDFD